MNLNSGDERLTRRQSHPRSDSLACYHNLNWRLAGHIPEVDLEVHYCIRIVLLYPEVPLGPTRVSSQAISDTRKIWKPVDGCWTYPVYKVCVEVVASRISMSKDQQVILISPRLLG